MKVNRILEAGIFVMLLAFVGTLYLSLHDNVVKACLLYTSMTLSRPIPAGFGWWGAKRTREAVEKMLRDMKAAVEALHVTANLN